MIRRPSRSTLTDSLFPYTTLFRSGEGAVFGQAGGRNMADDRLEQRFERAFARVGAVGGETAAARGVEDREVELRSEEHTSELQSLMRISYAVFCLNKKKHNIIEYLHTYTT